MHILVSNDDGYQAPGLRALVDALSHAPEETRVTVVAPDRDRSGASNSLTLDMPIRARHISPDLICVEGTPTDCVHLAITGLLEDEPDIVVSGINAGANMGDDVLYSGTVAAATEGRFLGLPAMAVSLASTCMYPAKHYETAARISLDLIYRLSEQSLSFTSILNVNIPDIPFEEIKGIQATRLGYRHKAEPVVKSKDPRGKSIYWVGPAGPEQDAGEGTDFHAVRNGYVSVTPLQVDLTRHDAIQPLADWLES